MRTSAATTGGSLRKTDERAGSEYHLEAGEPGRTRRADRLTEEPRDPLAV